MREDLAGLFLDSAIYGDCLVAETGKQVLTVPGAMQEAETWSRGIYFKCMKILSVYF